MDPFACLPFPILVIVAKAVPDLLALHSLRAASPAVADLLRNDSLAVEIADAVLAQDPLPCTRAASRLALLLLGRPPCAWAAVLALCTTAVQDAPLPRDMPASAVRQLLALALVVQAAADRCLDTCLARCAALRPRRPVDASVALKNRWAERTHGRPMPPVPDMPVVVDRTAAPPLQWVEQSRALCGAWQLAVFSVLRPATPAPSWTAAVPVLQSAVLLWRALQREVRSAALWPREELQTLVDDDGGFDALYLHNMVRYGVVGLEQDDEVDPRDTIDDIDVPVGTCLRLADVCPTATPRPDPYAGRLLPDGAVDGFTGLGARLPWSWMQLTQLRHSHRSYLRHMAYAPFRALGFFLWERPRFEALSLYTPDALVPLSYGGNRRAARFADQYAWWSVLSPAQRATLEERQQRVWGPRR